MASGDSFSHAFVARPREGGHSQAALLRLRACVPRRDEIRVRTVPLLSHLGSTLVFLGRVIRQLGGLQDIPAEADRLPYRIQWAVSTSTALARFLQIQEIHHQRDAGTIQHLYFPEHPTDEERALSATSAYVAQHVPGVFGRPSDTSPTPDILRGAPPTSLTDVVHLRRPSPHYGTRGHGPNHASSSSTPPQGQGPTVDPTPGLMLPRRQPCIRASPICTPPVSMPAPAAVYTVLPPMVFPAPSAPPPTHFQAAELPPYPSLQPHVGLPYQAPLPINTTFHEPGTQTHAAQFASPTHFFAEADTEQERRLKRMEETIRALQAEDIPTWADLSRKFIDQYQYCAEMPPTLLELSMKEMAHGQRFEEYATKWRAQAAKHIPPISEVQQIQLFHSTLRGVYYSHLLAHTSSFSDLIKAGKKLDLGIKLGRMEGPTALQYQPPAPRVSQPTQQVPPPQGQQGGVAPPRPREQYPTLPVPLSHIYQQIRDKIGTIAPGPNFVIDVPGREPYSDDKVPWTYEGSVGSLEQQLGVMGITRSGRVYENPAVADKGKAPAAETEVIPGVPHTPPKRVTEEEAEAFMKIIKASEYKVVEQMAKSPAHISLLALLLSLEPHREALLRVLTAAQDPKGTSPDRMEETINSIFSNTISFSDDELPSEGCAHSQALHIVCKCNNHIVGRVMIDNGSALNVCSVTTLKQMNVDLNSVRSSKTAVQAFDGSRREVNGEIDLLIDVSPCSFSVTF
ncbi:hypothetical protein CRG98_000652 [Punica granatum]|uniref:Retrotransposon gag domain-containing protein n=1 Tax=Punica granatum TaxID=22663 RepID=A0A2I0LE54_PUNGR|nr:hypothetical protein CRG98_000652 [Punica granatum]